MVRVLLDESLPLRAAQWLRDCGIDAVHAREVGLASMPDTQVLALARTERRVCFTLDHDFHSLLAETAATAPSVVLLRMQQAGYVETGQLIALVLREFDRQLEEGSAIAVTRRAIRLRSLPLK